MKNALEFFTDGITPPGEFSGGEFSISSLTGASDAFLAVALAAKDEGLVFVIVPGLPDAERLADDIRLLTGDPAILGPEAYAIRTLDFPPPLGEDKSSLGTRLRTVTALRARPLAPWPGIVIVPSVALETPIPMGTDNSVVLKPGLETPFSSLVEKLTAIGYERVPSVEKEGDLSVRGGILDIWSPGEEFPFRCEFFGDDLESLRTFDPGTQLSVTKIHDATVLPIRERDGETSNSTILDLLPTDATVLVLEHNDYPSVFGPNAAKLPRLVIYSGDPAPRGVPSLPFQTAPLPGFAELVADEAHHPELFDAARKRLDAHVASAEKRGDLVLRIEGLSLGFETKGLVVVTKADRVFTKRKSSSHRINAAVAQGPRLNDFDELEPGEYVVHVDYGVGRFIGSSEIVVDGKRSEVFTIEYADGGKLHVPSTHAHLLSRYVGVRGEQVHLHRLDGKRWAKDKAEAQRAVTDLAASLLETQARRETVPGFVYDVNCEGHEAFDAAFPYDETPDQAAAIAAIRKDLAASKPMDRLICGDAGYGKTEIAMRAAFIAAMNGKQVAVLAPTTVLAEQHLETFTSRFDGTPIRIESVSRFQSTDTHRGTFKRIATGACDIVIGTHAILSPHIAFHDLGLIIIDEEQRFGVRHKEFLKALRATADILTLSATPIPRTLYLSMTGARDLSLLRTPPRERVAVETRILRDSDEAVTTAIESELARGGQVFFLHNRVTSIGRVEKRLKSLIPTARIVTAHGQMDSKTLARKMRDFERGEYDILLSTTIVESGIDIPRANTILVDQAHTFGLADLYQLRGRVGRSSRQGYAYFLLPADGLVDSDARERLAALKRHGGLGAGFNLAVRDLELRGAGNLLGSQQSGHIAAVGFGLYCQLLQRTVALLKGEKVKDIVDVKTNLDFIDASPASDNPDAAAALPYDYVEEDAQRISFMKRLASATDVKIVKALSEELEDRFGKMPPAAKRLVRLAELRVLCAEARIGALDVKGTRAVYYKSNGREIAKVIDLRGQAPDRKISELINGLKQI